MMTNIMTKSTLFRWPKGLLLLFLVILIGCRDRAPEAEPAVQTEPPSIPETIIWHVKAVHPEGRFIDIKALDAEGNIYDVKALQVTEQRQLMDIKAIMGEARIPVKVLLSEDTYAPVKAIGADGTIYDIKALDGGEKLNVKGVRRAGNIIDIKAITAEGQFYGVKAISPEGRLNDVKGVKVAGQELEGTVSGVQIHAHIKALPQSEGPGNAPIWHIKAIHPGGWTLDVKALDGEGNIFDVKALQDGGQRQFMDVKALRGELQIPVKILVSDAAYAPVKAIGADGTIYDIKALEDGKMRDVKGVRTSGNLIHIKAIGEDGSFYGIKAISPEGLLNDVKGVRVSETELEATINKVPVRAHVKALPQID